MSTFFSSFFSTFMFKQVITYTMANECKKYEYDYLIVGAGLAGATFAWLAGEAGKKCLVVDIRQHIGGNLYTENIESINVHKYGPHIFHTSNLKVWEFINQFADFNRFTYSPILKSKGLVLNLPFNMNTFYKLWGTVSPGDAAQRIVEECLPYQNFPPSNLEEQALSLVGKEIYEIMIKEYTQKQWGRTPKELPNFIIKRLPIRYTYDNNYFNDSYQGIPIGGYTSIIEKMLKKSTVLLNADFIKNKSELLNTAKTLIYTGCIDSYFDYYYGKLEYRSLRLEEELVEITNYQGNAVVNYGDLEIPFTRIIEHKHFEFINNEVTVVTKEYPVDYCSNNEPFYPINDDINNSLYAKYEELAQEQPNVYFIGRLANYKYYDMHQIIEKSFGLFEKIQLL